MPVLSRFFLRAALPAVLAVLLAAPASWAMIPTINCHCFQDRAYDPSRPSAADAYFLASAQNTLLAVVFERSKRDVVLAKQGGTSNDDLWIAYRAAQISDLSPGTLLGERRRAAHWGEVLTRNGIELAVPGVNPQDGWDEALARAILEQVLAERGLATPAVLAQLRAAGCGPQETILALLLARAGGRPAFAIVHQVKEQNQPWGELLAQAGLADDLGAAVRQAVQTSPGEGN
ncbi:hypothetical protein [Geoalkalibacter sp.]|uniref:hypothetical protein n=1 Tax=Geoalkalibacter sp. TaxID=3041440 RepID=UPI00272E5883|nr:hypothetical protein [Geoalkalibacter sp.]